MTLGLRSWFARRRIEQQIGFGTGWLEYHAFPQRARISDRVVELIDPATADGSDRTDRRVSNEFELTSREAGQIRAELSRLGDVFEGEIPLPIAKELLKRYLFGQLNLRSQVWRQGEVVLVSRINASFLKSRNELELTTRWGTRIIHLPNERTMRHLRGGYMRGGQIPKWEGWRRHQREILFAAGSLGFLGVSIYLVHCFRQRYKTKLAAREHALATVDPAEIERWQAAYNHERSLYGLKSRFRKLNTRWETRVYRSYNGTFYTQRVAIPCNLVSPPDFWLILQGEAQWPSLKAVWARAGYTPEQVFDQLFLTRIPAAGPSPIPDAPSKGLHIIGSLFTAVPCWCAAATCAGAVDRSPEQRALARIPT